MNLLEYSIQILEYAEQITLPTLGRFKLVFESAKFDSEARKTIPPNYKVLFSQQHNLSDNSIAREIAKLEKKTSSEVEIKINQILVDWKHELKTQGYLYLDGLGTLTFEKEKIEFKISDNCIFNFKNFGLPAI